MIQTKYLVSLIFLFSGGANGLAFGSKLLNSGGAFLQKLNDSLRKTSYDLEDLTQKETDRLTKEKEASTIATNKLKENNKKMSDQIEQTDASRKEVEKKLEEAKTSQTNQAQKLKEYQEKTQRSYEEESQSYTAKLQEEAQKLSEQFKKTWQEQDQKLKEILAEIQQSNKEKIEKLAKDIEDLPNRIFLNTSKKPS